MIFFGWVKPVHSWHLNRLERRLTEPRTEPRLLGNGCTRIDRIRSFTVAVLLVAVLLVLVPFSLKLQLKDASLQKGSFGEPNQAPDQLYSQDV